MAFNLDSDEQAVMHRALLSSVKIIPAKASMINSRDLSDLHPIVRRMAVDFLAKCLEARIDILVTSCYRDAEAQSALYAQGRTTPGRIVTNARAGESWHNWRFAFDVVPLRYGKPVWGTGGIDGELWTRVGEIGESVGLEWAGRWRGRLREMAHFQWTGGLTIAQLKAGVTITA